MSAVERARALKGVRFRLHGRGDGLDCVGVIAAVFGADAPTGYALRGGDPEVAAALLDARFARADALSAGDVVLMVTGPGQLHLGVWTGEGLVHADAGLRRVVERPGVPPWPVLGMWRGN
jgi:hypothetical protein